LSGGTDDVTARIIRTSPGPPVTGAPTAPPFDAPIYVTRPLLPPLRDYVALLEGIWERRWLSNEGQVHDALEQALCEYLRVRHLSLVANGTLALALAYRALKLSGEVITTPFTSPATVNALTWCGLMPVFADIDPVTLTIDPDRIETAITERTSAIVGVHIYGMPCEVGRIGQIAARCNLRVIYDGAHAFGAAIDGKPIAQFGDATTLSFHATKLFNSAEGGAIVVADPHFKELIDSWRMLGFRGEETVVVPGINARINELEAALGLANLGLVAAEQAARADIAGVYASRLAGRAGLTCYEIPPNVTNSRLYFLLRIDGSIAPLSRDALWERLKRFNVFARRYFHPLCSDLTFYRDLPSARAGNLPVARRAVNEVLCLPFYGALGVAAAHRICDIIDHIWAN
jgi:dTDP-4-amino-4,6-dideoxygalactose transaminase